MLEDLDERELTNHVLVITRHQMKPDDVARLNALRHVKVTLLFTYSGIDNKAIEPYPSSVAAESLKLMCRLQRCFPVLPSGFRRPQPGALTRAQPHERTGPATPSASTPVAGLVITTMVTPCSS